jgi:hypothetical protein
MAVVLARLVRREDGVLGRVVPGVFVRLAHGVIATESLIPHVQILFSLYCVFLRIDALGETARRIFREVDAGHGIADHLALGERQGTRAEQPRQAGEDGGTSNGATV